MAVRKSTEKSCISFEEDLHWISWFILFQTSNDFRDDGCDKAKGFEWILSTFSQSTNWRRRNTRLRGHTEMCRYCHGSVELRDGPLMIWGGPRAENSCLVFFLANRQLSFFSWPTCSWVLFPGQPAVEFFSSAKMFFSRWGGDDFFPSQFFTRPPQNN